MPRINRPAGPPGTVTGRSGNFVNVTPENYRAAPGQRPLRNVPFRQYQPPAPTQPRVPTPAPPSPAHQPGADSPLPWPSPPPLSPADHEGASILLSMSAPPSNPGAPPSTHGYEGDRSSPPSPGSLSSGSRPRLTLEIPSATGCSSPASTMEHPPDLSPAHSGSTLSAPSPFDVYTPDQYSMYGFSVTGSDRDRLSPVGTRLPTPEPEAPFQGTFPGALPSREESRRVTPWPPSASASAPTTEGRSSAPSPSPSIVDRPPGRHGFRSPSDRPMPDTALPSRAPTPFAHDAPTPGGFHDAPTPGGFYTAPTPGAYRSPTPYDDLNAPTPGYAPTPGAYPSTPSVAPTPQAWRSPSPAGPETPSGNASAP